MAFVYGPTNSDILNAADGITSGDDHVEVMGTTRFAAVKKCDGAHRVLIRVSSQAV